MDLSNSDCVQLITVAAGILVKKEHKLKGSIIQVCYFEDNEDKAETDQLRDTLEVSNFPADVSKELVELYFENPRSGGCEGAVKSITIIGPGVAQVQFSTDTGECATAYIALFLTSYYVTVVPWASTRSWVSAHVPHFKESM